MGTSTVKRNPSKHSSGNWVWWEFSNGLIVGHFYVSALTFTTSTASGQVFRTSSAITVETPPFSFNYGSTSLQPGGQSVWATNINTTATGVKCYFVCGASGSKTIGISGIFVGVK